MKRRAVNLKQLLARERFRHNDANRETEDATTSSIHSLFRFFEIGFGFSVAISPRLWAKCIAAPSNDLTPEESEAEERLRLWTLLSAVPLVPPVKGPFAIHLDSPLPGAGGEAVRLTVMYGLADRPYPTYRLMFVEEEAQWA